ncbi:hypothetical protein ACN47E_002250 [Coniothyrium glycines]
MAQIANQRPHYHGQQLQDGTVVETPVPPPHGHGSSDSKQELLRLPAQPHPAHIDANMEPISPLQPNHNNAIGLTPRSSNIKRVGGFTDPNDYTTSGRAYTSFDEGQHLRKQSQDTRGVSYGPAVNRTAYVEDYSDEEDEQQQYHRRRQSRQRRPPPVVYDNYYERNSRHNSLPPQRVGSVARRSAYRDVPQRPEYNSHMHYGSDDEYGHRYTGGAGGGRGPPRGGPPPESVMRLPWAIWMGSNAKNHFVAFVGEFVGTTMFLFFAFSGTQVANIGSSAPSTDNTTTGESAGFSPIVLLYIALVFAFSLMVNVWVFFRISGGLFNPAVTFAMLLCRALSPVRACLLLAAQIAGSIFASYLVSVLFPTQFNVRTTLGEGTSLAQGVLIETVLTAELVFTIFMLAKEKHKATFIAPVGIGLALFIGELVGVYYTGGSLNPARSFGPCVITGVFDTEHWIYWVGPAVGAILAVVFYKFIKILEYEVANPGQDDDDKDQEVKEKISHGEIDVEAGTPVKRKPQEPNGFGS